MLTLVDNAARGRLREAYLRLRSRDRTSDVIVDVRKLADLPQGTTVILALKPPIDNDSLDWLNLNRPLIADRQLNIVLWCEDDAASVLAQRAPDFFDWISARVDCPPAYAAHAVARVKRAICARASGIVWNGPGLEATLAIVRPGRPVRRIAVASYQSMLDALTSRERGWLVLDGVDTSFHLRRLRWAMAETGRRTIVFRRSIDETAPGWWTVAADHASISGAVEMLTELGGTGRLAALTGLDPKASEHAGCLLRRGVDTEHLEHLLATTPDPRAALEDFAQQRGWKLDGGIAHSPSEADPVVLALRERLMKPERWAVLAKIADDVGDFEIAIRWQTRVLESLSKDVPGAVLWGALWARGSAHQSMGDLVSARVDFERVFSAARDAGDTTAIAISAGWLAEVLFEQDEALRARECLESALVTIEALGGNPEYVIWLRDLLGRPMMGHEDWDTSADTTRLNLPLLASQLRTFAETASVEADLEGARNYLELSLKRDEGVWGTVHPAVVYTLRRLARVHSAMDRPSLARGCLERALAAERVLFGSDEHPDIADTLVELASVMKDEGDLEGAQSSLERALAIKQKWSGPELGGASARQALANVLLAKGDVVGALGHIEQALMTLREIFKDRDHPQITELLKFRQRLLALQHDLQRTD